MSETSKLTNIEPVGFSEPLKVGDLVMYLGATDDQVHWGACYDPRGILSINQVYQLERVDIHTWHTKIFLKGIDSHQGFNSASFRQVIP